MLSVAKDLGFFYLFSDVLIGSHLILSMQSNDGMIARLWSGPTTNSTLLLTTGQTVTNGVSIVNGQTINFATHGEVSEVWLQVLAPGTGSISYGFAGTNNAAGISFTDTLPINAYREKLYVHISELPGLANMPSFNAPALGTYNLANVMTQVVAFCADPERGIGLDVEWVRDDLVFDDPPLTDIDGVVIAPNTYRYNGPIRQYQGATSINGSGFMFRDRRYLNLPQKERFWAIYYEGPSSFAQERLLQETRRDDLPKYVRLNLIDRWVEFWEGPDNPSAEIVNENAFTSFMSNTPFQKCGAVVAVAAMAEEYPYTPSQFINRLAWVIAHELGHLIIREQTQGDWVAHHLNTLNTTLMGSVFGTLGLSDIVGDLREIEKINLKTRASVQPGY